MALVIIGAIFTFAIRKELPGIDIQVVGLILMVAGGVLVAHARHGRVHEEKVTRVEESPDPARPTHSVATERSERDLR